MATASEKGQPTIAPVANASVLNIVRRMFLLLDGSIAHEKAIAFAYIANDDGRNAGMTVSKRIKNKNGGHTRRCGPHACVEQEHKQEVTSGTIVDFVNDRSIQRSFARRRDGSQEDSDSKKGGPLGTLKLTLRQSNTGIQRAFSGPSNVKTSRVGSM